MRTSVTAKDGKSCIVRCDPEMIPRFKRYLEKVEIRTSNLAAQESLVQPEFGKKPRAENLICADQFIAHADVDDVKKLLAIFLGGE